MSVVPDHLNRYLDLLLQQLHDSESADDYTSIAQNISSVLADILEKLMDTIDELYSNNLIRSDYPKQVEKLLVGPMNELLKNTSRFLEIEAAEAVVLQDLEKHKKKKKSLEQERLKITTALDDIIQWEEDEKEAQRQAHIDHEEYMRQQEIAREFDNIPCEISAAESSIEPLNNIDDSRLSRFDQFVSQNDTLIMDHPYESDHSKRRSNSLCRSIRRVVKKVRRSISSKVGHKRHNTTDFKL